MRELRYRSHFLVTALAAAVAAAACAPDGTQGTAASPPEPRRERLPIALDIPDRADATPWVAASGNFVAVAWGASGDAGWDVYLAVSRDGGQTFASPVQVNTTPAEARLGGEFPPRVALTPATGGGDPEVAVLWTARGKNMAIKVARSRDGGRTFAPAVTLQSPDAAGDRGWPAVAFDSDARLHAIWLDHRGMVARPAGTKSHSHAGDAATHDGAEMAQRSALYYASLAESADPERRITTGVCYCCKTALAAGPGGELHAAWRHVYPGNLRDMAFTTSRDGGRTFAAPQRVAEDGWIVAGCPDDGPAMAVDAQGTVHLVWPTMIAGEKAQGALFYAATRDGRQFTERVRVPTLDGPKPSHPQIAVDRAGRIFVAWDESVDGKRAALMREVKAAADGAVSFGDVITIAPEAMYPVLAGTADGLVAAWSGLAEASTVGVRVFAR